MHKLILLLGTVLWISDANASGDEGVVLAFFGLALGWIVLIFVGITSIKKASQRLILLLVVLVGFSITACLALLPYRPNVWLVEGGSWSALLIAAVAVFVIGRKR